MSTPHPMTNAASPLAAPELKDYSMSSVSARDGASRAPKMQRRIAATRAGAAVLWVIVYAIALHGQRVLSHADIPVLVGLLVAIYPAIDATAMVAEWRSTRDRPELRAGFAVDLLAIAGLLVSTLALHAEAVVIGFGAWALVAGLLQFAGAWRIDGPRSARVPLFLSGGISAVVGATFIASASHHVAHLSSLIGYPLLGAVFFLVYSAIDYKRRANVRSAR